jgi:hypothetical protein
MAIDPKEIANHSALLDKLMPNDATINMRNPKEAIVANNFCRPSNAIGLGLAMDMLLYT